jgi:hypothetical protein
LFVLNEGQRHGLFHNDAGRGFTRSTTAPLATDIGNSVAFAWGDYDNDGFVDLFVANRNGLHQSNDRTHSLRCGLRGMRLG